MSISHFELCEITARRFGKKLALYEYQSFVSGEFPDVLTFENNSTTLFEIKTSHSDFLADAKKEARIKWKPKGYWLVKTCYSPVEKRQLKWISQFPEMYYIEKPHLGSRRFFVCEPEIIHPEEVPDGWGLYWYKNGKFFKKVDSKKWRPDVHTERNLLAHALRRYASGDKTGIYVNTYEMTLRKADDKSA